MATRSELRTRLQRRLGLGVVSLVEREKLNESINSGIARAHSDGVPGLARWQMTGGVLGRLDLTSVTVTTHSQDVSITGPHLQNNHVHPRDILVVVEASGDITKFLIEDIHGASSLHLGLRANKDISGTSDSYILRRTIQLPSSGQVVKVFPVGRSSTELQREPDLIYREPFKEGTALYYEQGFSDLHNESSVSLWPAPSDTSLQWTVIQAQAKVRLELDTDTLDYPEEALDAVLERACMAYRTWGSGGSVGLSASSVSVRDTADSLKNSSNPKQIFYKT